MEIIWLLSSIGANLAMDLKLVTQGTPQSTSSANLQPMSKSGTPYKCHLE